MEPDQRECGPVGARAVQVEAGARALGLWLEAAVLMAEESGAVGVVVGGSGGGSGGFS